MKSTFAIVLISLMTLNAFAAGVEVDPVKARPRPKVDEKLDKDGRPVQDPMADGRTAVQRAEAARAERADLRTDAQKAKDRLIDITKKAQISLEAPTERDLLEAMQNINISAEVGALESVVGQIVSEKGRLSADPRNNQQKMVTKALEYLSKAKGEQSLDAITMKFEMALKQGFANEITAIMDRAMEIQQQSNGRLTLSESTDKALEERGLTEEEVRNCKEA